MANNNRRRDKDHDIGDSMPGTTGESQGTHHDRMGGGQTYNPEEDTMSEQELEAWLDKSNRSKNRSKSKQRTKE